MGHSRFMVIKAKDILRTAVFVVLAVIVVIALSRLFLAGRSAHAAYKPGTYTAQVDLGEESAEVEVKVSDRRIQSVRLIHTSETAPVFYPLLTPTMDTLAKNIVKAQSTRVELPDDAAVTGQLLLTAVDEALAKAKP